MTITNMRTETDHASEQIISDPASGGMPTPYGGTPRRVAREGETCMCGKAAVEVVLFKDLGPVPTCKDVELTDKRNGHRPGDCPSWCIGDHSLPFDRLHNGKTYEVELDAHPQLDRVNGELMTFRQPLLAGLTKEPTTRPAYIEIVGVEDKLAGKLTAYEAERLAGILYELATTMRREEEAA